MSPLSKIVHRLIFLSFRTLRKRTFSFAVILLIAAIFISGLPLYLRIYIDIPISLQQLARSIHFYTIWIFSITAILHTLHILRLENSSPSRYPLQNGPV